MEISTLEISMEISMLIFQLMETSHLHLENVTFSHKVFFSGLFHGNFLKHLKLYETL